MFVPLNRSQANSLPGKKDSQSEAAGKNLETSSGSETESDDDFDLDDPFVSTHAGEAIQLN